MLELLIWNRSFPESNQLEEDSAGGWRLDIEWSETRQHFGSKFNQKLWGREEPTENPLMVAEIESCESLTIWNFKRVWNFLFSSSRTRSSKIVFYVDVDESWRSAARFGKIFIKKVWHARVFLGSRRKSWGKLLRNSIQEKWENWGRIRSHVDILKTWNFKITFPSRIICWKYQSRINLVSSFQ